MTSSQLLPEQVLQYRFSFVKSESFSMKKNINLEIGFRWLVVFRFRMCENEHRMIRNLIGFHLCEVHGHISTSKERLCIEGLKRPGSLIFQKSFFNYIYFLTLIKMTSISNNIFLSGPKSFRKNFIIFF